MPISCIAITHTTITLTTWNDYLLINRQTAKSLMKKQESTENFSLPDKLDIKLIAIFI